MQYLAILCAFLHYNPNNIKKVIIKPNNAIASHNAKPKIAYINKSFCKKGFLLTEFIKPLKTIPIPIPEPRIEIVDSPADINLADWIIIISIYFIFKSYNGAKPGHYPVKHEFKIQQLYLVFSTLSPCLLLFILLY